MKKPYQIEAQRAVKQLEAMAAAGDPAVQMVLPMAEIVGWRHKGVGELIRQAGLQLMDLLMREEVRELVGERSQRQAERTANRWGSERGYCVVMGQKVPVERLRVRTTDEKEVRLGSYEMFHRGEPLTETVWEKLMLGLSTRKYGQAIRQFIEAYGLEKRAVSEHFIEASRAKLKEMMERRLEETRLCALLIDATPFEGQQIASNCFTARCASIWYGFFIATLLFSANEGGPAAAVSENQRANACQFARVEFVRHFGEL